MLPAVRPFSWRFGASRKGLLGTIDVVAARYLVSLDWAAWRGSGGASLIAICPWQISAVQYQTAAPPATSQFSRFDATMVVIPVAPGGEETRFAADLQL